MSQSVKDNKSAIQKEAKAAKPAKKRSATARRYLTYLTFIVIVGVIGVIIALFKYFGAEKIKRNASVTIQFTYDGAAKNLTPTGEKFSINGVTSDKVLEDALTSVGFSGKYTADSIRQSIVVNGQYPADVIDKIKGYNSLYNFSGSTTVTLENYFPTSYKVTLYDDFDPKVSNSDMERIIQAIGQTYKDYFISNYIYAYDSSSLNSIFVNENYDFAYRVKIIKLRIQELKDYASEMYEKNAAFRSKGLSFSDIVVKCKNLENDSISNIEAAVMTDVLTVSAARLRNQYEYEIKILENEKTYKNSNLESIDGLLETYQLDGIMFFGSGDAVVKVERNSKDTYEKLIKLKKELAERIVEIDSEIQKYKTYINDMNSASSATESMKTLINNQISDAFTRFAEIEELFDGMVSDYNGTLVAEETVNLEKNRFVSGKLFSSGFIVTAIKCAGPLCIIVMIICAFHAFLVERKKYARRNQEAAA